MVRLRHWFRDLPTAGKLLLLLTAAILPLGLVLVTAAASGIDRANQALEARASDQARLLARALDGNIGRNVLALRIAANDAVEVGGDACARTERALLLAPNVPRAFVLRDSIGTVLCARGANFADERPTMLVPPGQVRLWISPDRNSLFYRIGVYNGSVTGSLDREQMRGALSSLLTMNGALTLADGNGELRIKGAEIVNAPSAGDAFERTVRNFDIAVGGGQLRAQVAMTIDQVPSFDRLILLLPVIMWILATVLSWLVVRIFLLRPLRRMQRAVTAYQPGSGELVLPERLGSAIEIRDLGQSFQRAVERIEHSEKEMAGALEGQRKLVREVHHRVKNNLQVVASLLNIHRRSAGSDDARDAYSSIGRRVDALAVVHRNHYAELEENRGIALRPLLSELASNLRGSAPESARRLEIEVDLDILNTTQDVAVAAAFLTTEIVEHAMLTRPDVPVSLTLRRTGDLTARYTLASAALSEDLASNPEHQQFERIVAGLAKQLRSSLDKAPGRYSVDLPVFPPR